MTIQFTAKLIREPLTKKRNNDNKNWQECSYQWIVTINGESFDYYTGAGLVVEKHGHIVKPKEPTLDDVLYSLCSDSEACDMSFNDWCWNFGYDTDSREALRVYLLCQENTEKLRKAGVNIQAEKERLQDY